MLDRLQLFLFPPLSYRQAEKHKNTFLALPHARGRDGAFLGLLLVIALLVLAAYFAPALFVLFSFWTTFFLVLGASIFIMAMCRGLGAYLALRTMLPKGQQESLFWPSFLFGLTGNMEMEELSALYGASKEISNLLSMLSSTNKKERDLFKVCSGIVCDPTKQKNSAEEAKEQKSDETTDSDVWKFDDSLPAWQAYLKNLANIPNIQINEQLIRDTWPYYKHFFDSLQGLQPASLFHKIKDNLLFLLTVKLSSNQQASKLLVGHSHEEKINFFNGLVREEEKGRAVKMDQLVEFVKNPKLTDEQKVFFIGLHFKPNKKPYLVVSFINQLYSLNVSKRNEITTHLKTFIEANINKEGVISRLLGLLSNHSLNSFILALKNNPDYALPLVLRLTQAVSDTQSDDFFPFVADVIGGKFPERKQTDDSETFNDNILFLITHPKHLSLGNGNVLEVFGRLMKKDTKKFTEIAKNIRALIELKELSSPAKELIITQVVTTNNESFIAANMEFLLSLFENAQIRLYADRILERLLLPQPNQNILEPIKTLLYKLKDQGGDIKALLDALSLLKESRIFTPDVINGFIFTLEPTDNTPVKEIKEKNPQTSTSKIQFLTTQLLGLVCKEKNEIFQPDSTEETKAISSGLSERKQKKETLPLTPKLSELKHVSLSLTPMLINFIANNKFTEKSRTFIVDKWKTISSKYANMKKLDSFIGFLTSKEIFPEHYETIADIICKDTPGLANCDSDFDTYLQTNRERLNYIAKIQQQFKNKESDSFNTYSKDIARLLMGLGAATAPLVINLLEDFFNSGLWKEQDGQLNFKQLIDSLETLKRTEILNLCTVKGIQKALNRLKPKNLSAETQASQAIPKSSIVTTEEIKEKKEEKEAQPLKFVADITSIFIKINSKSKKTQNIDSLVDLFISEEIFPEHYETIANIICNNIARDCELDLKQYLETNQKKLILIAKIRKLMNSKKTDSFDETFEKSITELLFPLDLTTDLSISAIRLLNAFFTSALSKSKDCLPNIIALIDSLNNLKTTKTAYRLGIEVITKILGIKEILTSETGAQLPETGKTQALTTQKKPEEEKASCPEVKTNQKRNFSISPEFIREITHIIVTLDKNHNVLTLLLKYECLQDFIITHDLAKFKSTLPLLKMLFNIFCQEGTSLSFLEPDKNLASLLADILVHFHSSQKGESADKNSELNKLITLLTSPSTNFETASSLKKTENTSITSKSKTKEEVPTSITSIQKLKAVQSLKKIRNILLITSKFKTKEEVPTFAISIQKLIAGLSENTTNQVIDLLTAFDQSQDTSSFQNVLDLINLLMRAKETLKGSPNELRCLIGKLRTALLNSKEEKFPSSEAPTLKEKRAALPESSSTEELQEETFSLDKTRKDFPIPTAPTASQLQVKREPIKEFLTFTQRVVNHLSTLAQAKKKEEKETKGEHLSFSPNLINFIVRVVEIYNTPKDKDVEIISQFLQLKELPFFKRFPSLTQEGEIDDVKKFLELFHQITNSRLMKKLDNFFDSSESYPEKTTLAPQPSTSVTKKLTIAISSASATVSSKLKEVKRPLSLKPTELFKEVLIQHKFNKPISLEIISLLISKINFSKTLEVKEKTRSEKEKELLYAILKNKDLMPHIANFDLEEAEKFKNIINYLVPKSSSLNKDVIIILTKLIKVKSHITTHQLNISSPIIRFEILLDLLNKKNMLLKLDSVIGNLSKIDFFCVPGYINNGIDVLSQEGATEESINNALTSDYRYYYAFDTSFLTIIKEKLQKKSISEEKATAYIEEIRGLSINLDVASTKEGLQLLFNEFLKSSFFLNSKLASENLDLLITSLSTLKKTGILNTDTLLALKNSLESQTQTSSSPSSSISTSSQIGETKEKPKSNVQDSLMFINLITNKFIQLHQKKIPLTKNLMQFMIENPEDKVIKLFEPLLKLATYESSFKFLHYIHPDELQKTSEKILKIVAPLSRITDTQHSPKKTFVSFLDKFGITLTNLTLLEQLLIRSYDWKRILLNESIFYYVGWISDNAPNFSSLISNFDYLKELDESVITLVTNLIAPEAKKIKNLYDKKSSMSKQDFKSALQVIKSDKILQLLVATISTLKEKGIITEANKIKAFEIIREKLSQISPEKLPKHLMQIHEELSKLSFEGVQKISQEILDSANIIYLSLLFSTDSYTRNPKTFSSISSESKNPFPLMDHHLIKFIPFPGLIAASRDSFTKLKEQLLPEGSDQISINNSNLSTEATPSERKLERSAEIPVPSAPSSELAPILSDGEEETDELAETEGGPSPLMYPNLGGEGNREEKKTLLTFSLVYPSTEDGEASTTTATTDSAATTQDLPRARIDLYQKAIAIAMKQKQELDSILKISSNRGVTLPSLPPAPPLALMTLAPIPPASSSNAPSNQGVILSGSNYGAEPPKPVGDDKDAAPQQPHAPVPSFWERLRKKPETPLPLREKGSAKGTPASSKPQKPPRHWPSFSFGRPPVPSVSSSGSSYLAVPRKDESQEPK